MPSYASLVGMGGLYMPPWWVWEVYHPEYMPPLPWFVGSLPSSPGTLPAGVCPVPLLCTRPGLTDVHF